MRLACSEFIQRLRKIHFSSTDTFDSVSARQYRDGWLLKNSSQTLTGRVSLLSMTADAVTVAQRVKVQGFDLYYFMNTASCAFTDDGVVVTSSVQFGRFDVTGEVIVHIHVEKVDEIQTVMENKNYCSRQKVVIMY